MAAHGALDVMCNIAGIMVDSSIIDLDPDDFDRILGGQPQGRLYGCQAAGKVMVEQGAGSIINMASAAVLTPAAGRRGLRHLQGRGGPAHPVDGGRGRPARRAGQHRRRRASSRPT